MTDTDNNHYRSDQEVHWVRVNREGLKEVGLKPGLGKWVGKRQWEKKGKAFYRGGKER